MLVIFVNKQLGRNYFKFIHSVPLWWCFQLLWTRYSFWFNILLVGSSDIATNSAEPTQALEITVTDSFYWQTEVQAFKVDGVTKKDTEFALKDQTIIFDSGTAYLYVPECINKQLYSCSDSRYFTTSNYPKERLWRTRWYSNKLTPIGFWYTSCIVGSLPSFYLMFERHWLEIPP